MASAILSSCGSYRYRLDRGLPVGPLLAWIMVNPSTADATEDDATIRKVRGFTERAGFHHFAVGNKFAWRATDIRALRTVADPVGGEEANGHLRSIFADASGVVFAWGPLGKLPKALHRRWRTVDRLAREAGHKPMCLGTAADGHPLHPLMQPYSADLRPWSAP